MKKLFLLAFLVIGSVSLQAQDTELYAVARADGGVSIVQYIPGSNDSLTDVLTELGFAGRPVYEIKTKDLPAREDREFWTIESGKLKVDNAKKAEKLAEKASKDAKKDAVLTKLGITETEAKDLLDGLGA